MIPTGLTQVTGLPALVSFWAPLTCRVVPLLPDVAQSWHEVKHQVVAQEYILAKEYILNILTKTMGTQRDEKDISVFTTLNLEVSFPLE